MSTPTALVLNGKLYGYGPTRERAIGDLRQNTAGVPGAFQSMLRRVQFVALSDDEASEVAECVAAEAIRWEG